MTAPIAALVEALAGFWVAPDGRHARLGSVELEAPSARRLAERLGHELYRRLHSGSPAGDHGERDPALEAALAEATPHDTTPTAVTPLTDGVVLIDGLRVRIPPAMLTGPEILLPAPGPALSAPGPALSAAGPALSPGQTLVELPAARLALSPGHYLVDGPTGRLHGAPILRVYLHLNDPAEAPARWHDVLTALNKADVTYRAKIVSTPAGYPRRDAMVVYLGPGHWPAATLIRDTAGGRPGTGQELSLYAHPLAPGIAAAWDPDDPRPGHQSMSFGEHRARATAEALLRGTDLATSLAECFTEAHIDAAHPARNQDSPTLPELGL